MTRQIPAVFMVTAALLMGACEAVNPGDADERLVLRQQTQASLADFKQADPTLAGLLDSAYAYVLFPRITSGAFIAGGAYGKGEVYLKGKFVGHADVSQGSLGLQVGAQRFAELILFRTQSTYLNFTQNTWEFDARASAVAAASGSAAVADYSTNVLVITLPEGGLMAQAAVGVQRFTYLPEGQ